jgi:hypothetical protein
VANQAVMAGEQNPHEYTASLNVYSETIPLHNLTAALGPPTEAHDRGDPVSRSKPNGPKRAHTFWSLTSTGRRERPLEDQIEDLVSFAERHQHQFEALKPNPERRIFCGVFSGEDAQGGFILEPALLGRLANLDLVLVFDLY